MVDITTLTVASLLSVAGVATLTAAVVQIILTTAQPSDAAASRWGPLLAVLVGMALAIVAQILIGPVGAVAIGNSLITGFVGGLASMGIHNVLTKSGLGDLIATLFGINKASPPNPSTGS